MQESGVLTVLFTDVVGSTALLERLGDDAADSVRREHFATLRRAIADHRGREVKSLGDGLMVSFASARDAVACAAAMQQGVASESDGLELRVGIDAGEPIREDEDLFGTPVVVAKRLCDAAGGGQVLVSDVVRMLCGRRAPYPLESVGELALKGLDQPVGAHELRWVGNAESLARIRLCGGLVVERDGERLDDRLPSRQARVLFALLALNYGHALSRESLADALWPSEAPRSRDSSLRALLTGARRVFGADSVEGRDQVRLAVPGGVWIDVLEAQAAIDRATAALDRSDHDSAIEEARRAAELSADELLPGLSAPWIDDRRAEMEELSLRALEVEAEASLHAGRANDAEQAARRLVERAPYRESAYALLMEALAERGNIAEATLAYDRLRTLLREELGTAPAPTVVKLYERLIATDREPAEHPERPPLPVALVRAADRPFVARSSELTAMRTAWKGARGGSGCAVVLGGEPGIGKTSLTAVFAREAHEDGATVLLGRCHAEALVPYEPFVEALRQLPHPLLEEGADVLGRVMPELARGGLQNAVGEDPAARYLLFDTVARTLVAAAAEAPVVLLLDDLHWADQPTLLLLRHVARGAEEARLLTLITYRTTEVPGTEQVVGALGDLERELSIERLTLAGLDDDEVGEMIGKLEGRPASWLLGSAMRRDTAGNPLFVGQVLRHLDETGALVERDGQLALSAPSGRLGVPESAKELVGRRLAVLPDATASALRTAAVSGRAFRDDLIAAVEQSSHDAVVGALEEATAAGLVEEAGPDHHAFVHALVREAIYEQTSAARRAGLHRRVAEALEAGGRAEPAELAHHYLAAGDDSKGIDYSVAAAEAASGQFAYEDAAAHYRRALEALEREDTQRRCDLLLKLGEAEARAGDTPAAKSTYREAAELTDSPVQLARAALGYGGRLIWDVSRDDPYLIPLLERALSALGDADDPLRVRLLARLAGGPLRDASFPPERRSRLSREGLAMARRLGDPATLAYAIDGLILAHHGPDQTEQQKRLSAELVEVALEAGDKERAVEGYENWFDALFELGELAEAERVLEAMTALTEELRQPAQKWFAAIYRALVTLHKGRLVEAERQIEAARERGELALGWNATITYGLQLYVLRWQQGRVGEIEPLVRSSAEENPSYRIWRCVLAHMCMTLGHKGEARAELAALAEDDFSVLPFDEEWLVSISLLADTARALDDPARAAVLYGRLLPYAERVAISYPEVSLGAVSRYLGILAATMGRWADAARHYDDAVRINTATEARAWLAHTRRDQAEMLLALGDVERARDSIGQAVAGYSELGMGHWAERTAALESVTAPST